MSLKLKPYPFDLSDHFTSAEIGGLVLAGILVAGLVTAFLVEGCRWYNSRKKLSPDRWQLEDVREMPPPASPDSCYSIDEYQVQPFGAFVGSNHLDQNGIY